jgi:carboxyl-terminal processing protease
LADQSAKKIVKTIQVGDKTYKIGIIDVPAFYADWKAMSAGDKNYKSTTRDVTLLIDTLKNIDKVDAIVMDLRANGGGSLNEAIDLTGLFIDKGPVVQTRDYSNNIRINEDKKPGAAWTGPFGVMIDRLSASASEIFAGAIQDYGRGIVMGTQSYGKGTVQQTISLNDLVEPSILQKMISAIAANKTKDPKYSSTVILDKDGTPQLGQLNLTTGKFYRVNGTSTQHKGVMPDFNFPSLYPLDKIGEDTEASALPFDVIKPSNYISVANLSMVKGALLKMHNERMAKSLDYKILREDIDESKKRDAETSITLNEAKLKTERDALELKVLMRVNQLRASRGLAPVKKGDKATKEDAYDFVQDESLKIMVDLMKMADGSKISNTQPAYN